MQHKERHEIDQPVQHAFIQQYTIVYKQSAVFQACLQSNTEEHS